MLIQAEMGIVTLIRVGVTVTRYSWIFSGRYRYSLLFKFHMDVTVTRYCNAVTSVTRYIFYIKNDIIICP